MSDHERRKSRRSRFTKFWDWSFYVATVFIVIGGCVAAGFPVTVELLATKISTEVLI